MKLVVFYDPSVMGDEETASEYAASLRYEGHDASVEVDPDYTGWPPAPKSANITQERRASIKERERELIRASTETQERPAISDVRRLAWLARDNGWEIRVSKYDNGEVTYTRDNVQIHAGFGLYDNMPLHVASIVGGPNVIDWTEDIAVVKTWMLAKR